MTSAPTCRATHRFRPTATILAPIRWRRATGPSARQVTVIRRPSSSTTRAVTTSSMRARWSRPTTRTRPAPTKSRSRVGEAGRCASQVPSSWRLASATAWRRPTRPCSADRRPMVPCPSSPAMSLPPRKSRSIRAASSSRIPTARFSVALARRGLRKRAAPKAFPKSDAGNGSRKVATVVVGRDGQIAPPSASAEPAATGAGGFRFGSRPYRRRCFRQCRPGAAAALGSGRAAATAG